jgi:hypothetical protein
MFRKLQPPAGSLKLADGAFTERYYAEVLERLDPRKTVDELIAMADGKIPVLLCFEHPTSTAWCHRAMISAWFSATLGLEVPEYGREGRGLWD